MTAEDAEIMQELATSTVIAVADKIFDRNSQS